VSAEELTDLPNFSNSPRFSELEKSVLAYAEAMTRTPAEVPDDLFRSLTKNLGPAELVELTAAVALENFSSRFNRAFDVERE